MDITVLTTTASATHGTAVTTQDGMHLSVIAGARPITEAIGVQDITLGTTDMDTTGMAILMYRTTVVAGHITAEDGTITTTTGVVTM